MKTKDTTATNGGASADNLQHTLEHGVERATLAAHHTIDSLSDAAQPTIDHLRAGAHKAVDSAGGVATHAAGALGGKGDQLQDSGKRIVERAGGYVREHPVASLGMAVAAGYLLSRLLSSR
jgi:ElaB/YqjD/DUF883 family membrane-anchored ribosome-binding protein